VPEYNADRIRNLLVHLYWKVDDKKIHQIIKTDILDIKDYVKAVTRIID